MKKINSAIRIATLAILALLATVNINAADSLGIRNTIPAELTYEGMISKDPLFSLNIAGTTTDEDYYISVADTWGNVLYRETVKGAQINRKFLFKSEEIGDETLYLSVSCRKVRQPLVYEISRTTRAVEEFTISPVK